MPVNFFYLVFVTSYLITSQQWKKTGFTDFGGNLVPRLEERGTWEQNIGATAKTRKLAMQNI